MGALHHRKQGYVLTTEIMGGNKAILCLLGEERRTRIHATKTFKEEANKTTKN